MICIVIRMEKITNMKYTTEKFSKQLNKIEYKTEQNMTKSAKAEIKRKKKL